MPQRDGDAADKAQATESADTTAPTGVVASADDSTNTTPIETVTAQTEVIEPTSSTGSTTPLGAPAQAGDAGAAHASGAYGIGNATTSGSATTPTTPYGTPSGTVPRNSAEPGRPRVRVGAIVWGLLVMTFAAGVVAISATPEARRAFDDWVASLSPAGWVIIGVVALGVAVLLVAGTSAVRSAQRKAQARDRG